MPQYISLAQQGFWQPYQQLGDAAARYSDRKEKKKERQQDVDFRNVRRGDELAQQGRENTRADSALKLNLDAGNFSLQEGKKKAGQQTALENFDINSLSSPEQPVAPGFQGPPKPAVNLNLNVPFSAQPPQIQEHLIKYAHDNFLPLQALTQAFQGQQSALTGVQPEPKLPPGFTPTEYSSGPNGPEIKAVNSAAFGKAPEVFADAQGNRWQRDPLTGKVTPAPKDPTKDLSPQELNKISSLNQLNRNLDTIENLFKSVPSYSTGPVGGRVASYNPYNVNTAALDQAVELAIGNVFHGIQGQVGIMDAREKAAAKSLLPAITDSPEVRSRKLQRFREETAAALAATLGEYKAVGRDLGQLPLPQTMNIKPPTGAESQRFNSAQEADSSGVPPGTRVLILDPKSGMYLPAIKR